MRLDREVFKAVFDNAGVLVVVLDRDGRIRLFNRAAEELSGRTAEEVDGEFPWATVLPPDVADQVRREAFEAQVRERITEATRYTNEWLTASGERRLLEWSNTLLLDDGGDPEFMVAIGQDITERLGTERALREKERQLVEAQRLAALGSWALDLRSGTLSWSDEIFRIFEIDRATFPASYEGFLERVHPDDRALVDEAYSRSLEERHGYRIEHRVLLADGRIKWVEERGTTEYDDDGPFRSTGTVQDITERKRQRAELERALAEQSTLLREVHHRVRNNLLIISGLLFFERSRTDDPAAQAVLGGLERRLSAMTLAHEKLYRTEGRGRIELGQYLTELTRHILASIGLAAGGVTVVVDFEATELDMDRALPLGMMLSELVTNAAKHAFAGGRGGHLRVGSTVTEDGLVLSVADDGIGTTEEDLNGSDSFGWRLIRLLESQLDARVSLRSEQGTEVLVHVPLHRRPEPAPSS